MKNKERKEDIKKLINELFVEPRKNLYKWSKKTRQTAQVRIGYVGQHLASVVTGVKGVGTAARGPDLADGTEVKTCSRADQLGKCQNCGAKVLRTNKECPICESEDIEIKTDSHWIFSIRKEKELDLLLNDTPRILLTLIDRDPKNKRQGDTRIRIWKIDPDNSYVRDFFKEYFFENYKKKSSPAPCNLHPLKYDFYMMDPMLIFKATIKDNESVVIDFYDLENKKTEDMPSKLLTRSQFKKILLEKEPEEIEKRIKEIGRDKVNWFENYLSSFNKKEFIENLNIVKKRDFILLKKIDEEDRDLLEMKEKKTKSYKEEYTRGTKYES